MNRVEILENVAAWAGGIATGVAFVVLYVALATPVVETAIRLAA